MANLMELLEARGIEVRTQKTKLWSAPETIATGYKVTDFESVRLSTYEEGNVYAIIRENDKSKPLSFAKDQISADELESNDDGIVTSGLEGMTFSIGIVTAVRDDEELGITKGEVKAKIFVE